MTFQSQSKKEIRTSFIPTHLKRSSVNADTSVYGGKSTVANSISAVKSREYLKSAGASRQYKDSRVTNYIRNRGGSQASLSKAAEFNNQLISGGNPQTLVDQHIKN